MSEPVLSIRGLSRTYVTGDRRLDVLRGVDLDVMPGEVVGLIGPSGSGKSSLLHAAGLLEKPDAGTIRIAGQDTDGLDERERTRVRLHQIGFVYQFHHLLPEFTALDNVALPQRIAGATKAEARERAASLLSTLGLAERVDHQPAQ
ncbi:MAG TPA: ATP-binding cassette domain-containing protein, partial [Reyranella sp.]|nr:ATP-binding cassette domain-containing protein [Reyranella sp.]